MSRRGDPDAVRIDPVQIAIGRPLGRRAVMYLRFATPQRDTDSRQHLGVFQAAYALLENGELTREESQRLKHSLVWFKKNLPVPDRSLLNERAIFWFKAE